MTDPHLDELLRLRPARGTLTANLAIIERSPAGLPAVQRGRRLR
jgi:hypothetical protein